MPTFYNKAISTFNISDTHILRFNNLIDGSRYDKLYFYKIPKLLEYLKSNKKINKYMLFLDATDTNFYKPPINIVDDFLNYSCQILFCGDPNIWPQTEACKLYANKPKISKYCYLNSGAYIGYTDYIISSLEYLVENHPYPGLDDQGQWSCMYLKNTNNDILIDQQRKIFFSTLDSKSDITINNNKVTITTDPYIIHDNGPNNSNTIKLTKLL